MIITYHSMNVLYNENVTSLPILYYYRTGSILMYYYIAHQCMYVVGVCVCVFFPSILDIKFVGRTSRGHTGGRSHRIFNPPSFCGSRY